MLLLKLLLVTFHMSEDSQLGGTDLEQSESVPLFFLFIFIVGRLPFYARQTRGNLLN